MKQQLTFAYPLENSFLSGENINKTEYTPNARSVLVLMLLTEPKKVNNKINPTFTSH